MNCKLEGVPDWKKPDWKAYVLGEMDAAARRDAEIHATACSACQEELAGVRVTLDALSTLREEEVPRRIAFVSDKVFEPKWWQMFVRPSFAAGAVVAAAILAHGLMRPVQVVGTADAAAIEARVTAQVQGKFAAQMQEAVNKAVADTEKRDDQRTTQVLAAAEQRYAESADILNKQVAQIYAMNTGAGVR